jgi:two-component system catabolic regulation response regulator CreB
MPMNVLLIEDEPAIADTVVYALQSEGYTVDWRNTGESGIALVNMQSPDIVILDIGLPDMSGFEVFQKIRSISTIPVIFLTARNIEIDKVTGLEMGADDYVVKPFSPRELTARVRAVLRRTQNITEKSAEQSQNETGPFSIDFPRWTVSYQSTPLELTRHEFEILTTLLKKPGQIFSREKLLSLGWDAPEHRLDRTVDAHIKNIRAKLRQIDNKSDPIKTKRGVGYFASWQ